MTQKNEAKWHKNIPLFVGILTMLTVLGIGMFIIVEVLTPVDTFKFTSITTSKNMYKPFEDLEYTVVGCKFGDLPIQVNLQFEGVGDNHNEYPITSFTASVRAGCGVGVNHVPLPVHMLQGRYVMRDTLTTRVNAFHYEVVTGTSNVFTVIAAPQVGAPDAVTNTHVDHRPGAPDKTQ